MVNFDEDAQEEYILVQKSAIEENKVIRESLLKKIEEQKVEIAIIKESQESLEQANKDFIKDNENLKKSVKVYNEYFVENVIDFIIGKERIYLTEAAKTKENVK